MSGGGFTLINNVNSGGAQLQGGGFTIRDSKGDYVGGIINGGGYTYIPGIWGLFGGQVTENPDVPYGTVPLYISRNSNGVDIRITWEAAYVNPKIYALSGNGQGVFTNHAANWFQITNSGVVTQPPTQMGLFSLQPGQLLFHMNQVGQGTSECYYKGFESFVGDPKTAINPNTGLPIFPSAEAVGKVNVAVAGGKKWTALSIPFLNQTQDLNDLVGDQGGYSGTSNSDQDVLIFSWDSGAWNKASYFDGALWVNLTPNPAVYDGDKGLYIMTRGTDADKTISVFGRVKKLSTSTAYLIKKELNLVSFPYPRQLQLGQIGLDVGTANNNSDNADVIFGWQDNSWNLASYLNGAKTWTKLTPVGVDYLNAAKPILYYSKTAGDVKYKLNPSALGYQ